MSLALTSQDTRRFIQPEGFPKVAGGRSEAKTSGGELSL